MLVYQYTLVLNSHILLILIESLFAIKNVEKEKCHTLTYKRNKNERKTYDPTNTLIKRLFKVNYLKIKDIEIDINYNFFIFRN